MPSHPIAWVTLQHVDDLQVFQRATQVSFVARQQHVGKPRVLRSLGLLGQERTREASEFAPGRQPFAQRLRGTVEFDGLFAVEAQRLQHFTDDGRRVLVPHTECIARRIREAGIGEVDLEVTDLLGGTTPGERLVRNDFGRERLLAREPRFDGCRPQARHSGGLRTAAQRVAGAGNDALEPRIGERVVINVTVDAVEESPGAEREEPLVDLLAGLAELRVARITKREHRKRQLFEFRRTA